MVLFFLVFLHSSATFFFVLLYSSPFLLSSVFYLPSVFLIASCLCSSFFFNLPFFYILSLPPSSFFFIPLSFFSPSSFRSLFFSFFPLTHALYFLFLPSPSLLSPNFDIRLVNPKPEFPMCGFLRIYTSELSPLLSKYNLEREISRTRQGLLPKEVEREGVQAG